MSRSTSERVWAPLWDFLLLVLTIQLMMLDQHFVDFMLHGTKGARTVVCLDCDLRDLV